MATAYKIIGQSAPAATTETDLYTVPAATETIVSTIVVANRSATDATFRISVAPNGAATANSHYIAYDLSCGGNGINAFTFGITLNATDKIRVYASSANLTFSAFGTEIA
jgi:glucose-6-phosphate dehydrogenase assembly protein OpcA